MYQYKSRFAEEIQRMLAFKERLGYSKNTHEPSLQNFDAFCLLNFPDESHLSEEIVLAWMKRRPQEYEGGLKKRANTIRQFGLYLAYTGINAYILPSDFVGGHSSFIPYIFSDKELTAFFQAADRYEEGKFALCRHYTISVIFRLIYCCGLRPNEGRLLKSADIDLSNGRVLVRETKKNKERRIIMADDVCEMCCRYDALMRNYVPGRDFFFSSMSGTAYAPNTLIHFFRQCWSAAGGNLSAERTPTFGLYPLFLSVR